jgi:hypothetical protein
MRDLHVAARMQPSSNGTSQPRASSFWRILASTVSRERVRQIEVRAFEKVQRAVKTYLMVLRVGREPKTGRFDCVIESENRLDRPALGGKRTDRQWSK